MTRQYAREVVDARSGPIAPADFARMMTACGWTRRSAPGARAAVAVSGGADSLALAFLAADWARARGVGITALTVDHGLRTASRDEARQVGTWLARAGIAHEILMWREGAVTDSAIQKRARDARYALMASWCERHGARRLLTAHHRDDQAETVLMRLRRGSTLFGLAAMAPLRPLTSDGTVILCRPLLDVPKARLAATLRVRGQRWIEDPSNAEQRFERVRVRRLCGHLAREGVSANRLAGAARAARAVTEVLKRALAMFEASAVTDLADGGIAVDEEAFAALPKALRTHALARLLRRVNGEVYAPRQAKLDRLANWLDAPADTVAVSRTLAGCVVRRVDGVFAIDRERSRRGGKGGALARISTGAPCSGRAAALHPGKTVTGADSTSVAASQPWDCR